MIPSCSASDERAIINPRKGNVIRFRRNRAAAAGLLLSAIFTLKKTAVVITAVRPTSLMVTAFTNPLSSSSSSRRSSLQETDTRTAVVLSQPQRQIEILTKQYFRSNMENDSKAVPSSKRKNKSTDPNPVVVSVMQELMLGDFNFRGHWLTSTTAVSSVALALLLLLPMSADAAMSGGRMGGSFSSRGSFGQGSGFGSRSYRLARTDPDGFVPYGRENIGIGLGAFCLTNFAGLLFIGWAGLNTTSYGDIDMDDGTMNSALGSGTSVVQISVALDVPNRDDPDSILSVLTRLSQTARTDSRVGVQRLTSQVASELLERKLSILSASTQYQHFHDSSTAIGEFNTLSILERGKFEQETVSKYGGIDYSQRAPSRHSSTELVVAKATLAVVTILLAINGDSTKVPTIHSIQDVDIALRRIASDTKIDSCLQAAEILWTPEDRTETLSLDEVLVDYPKLRSV